MSSIASGRVSGEKGLFLNGRHGCHRRGVILWTLLIFRSTTIFSMADTTIQTTQHCDQLTLDLLPAAFGFARRAIKVWRIFLFGGRNVL